MKSIIYSLVVSAFLVGCGSTVPLTGVPVSDATGSSVSSTSTDGASGVTNGGMYQGDLGQSGSQSALPSAKRIVYFEYDSFVIAPEYQALISENARMITGATGRRVAIEGHTDETGGREYNLALGQKRAEAVAAALAVLGVPRSQLEAVSFGKEKPAVEGSDESAFSKNRRAEIRYQ